MHLTYHKVYSYNPALTDKIVSMSAMPSRSDDGEYQFHLATARGWIILLRLCADLEETSFRYISNRNHLVAHISVIPIESMMYLAVYGDCSDGELLIVICTNDRFGKRGCKSLTRPVSLQTSKEL
jgi:hypothetical protein